MTLSRIGGLAALICAATAFDPLLVSLLLVPAFAAGGALLYRGYHIAFEKRGDEAMRGLAFFFGLMFIIEVMLLMTYGADQRWADTSYAGRRISIGIIDLPLRDNPLERRKLPEIGPLQGCLMDLLKIGKEEDAVLH